VEAASRGVLALLEACITAQPSGKQNTFAAFNLPELVLVEVSQNNLPVSYANAFLKPVRVTHDGNLMENSIQRLSEYMERSPGHTTWKQGVPASRWMRMSFRRPKHFPL